MARITDKNKRSLSAIWRIRGIRRWAARTADKLRQVWELELSGTL